MDRRSFLAAAAVSPAIPVFANTEEGGFELPHVETFEELQEAVEKCAIHLNWKYNGRMGPKGSRTESGNPYITYCVGGPKPEGHSPVARTQDPNQALRLWFEEIEKEADLSKQLVWRVWPETQEKVAEYNESDPAYNHNFVHTNDGRVRLEPIKIYHIRTRLAFE